MKNKGFIKLYRNVLTKPEMTDLVAEHGAEGFGVYMMLLIYLAQCDDFEGAFTNGLLTQIAVQAHKSRKFVRHIVCDFHLFEINGKRFRIASEMNSNSIQNESKPQNSPARINRYAGEDIEIDKEKENKEKGGKVSDVIGPSAYETVDRAGLRHGHRGEPVPWWAPPQTDIRCVWSLCADCWTTPDSIDPKAEQQQRQQMTDQDFMMKTAWETLSEDEQQNIQDHGRRI